MAEKIKTKIIFNSGVRAYRYHNPITKKVETLLPGKLVELPEAEADKLLVYRDITDTNDKPKAGPTVDEVVSQLKESDKRIKELEDKLKEALEALDKAAKKK